ncbi:MAG: hypothetical protein Q9228_004760 [Teloschistes exilis]
MLQDCQSNSLIAAVSIADLIRSAIKANFSFARLDPGITWSVYMASMACLGALRRTPGDISIMSNLEVLLEGFQKFQPVPPRIDTLVPIICQEYDESLPPAGLTRPVTSSTTTASSPKHFIPGLTVIPVMLLAGGPSLMSPEPASRCFSSSSLDGLIVASSARSGRETFVSFIITDTCERGGDTPFESRTSRASREKGEQEEKREGEKRSKHYYYGVPACRDSLFPAVSA